MGDSNLLNIGTDVNVEFDKKTIFNFVLITIGTAVLFYMVGYFLKRTVGE